MNEPTLGQLERDVEAARAKLAADLSVLRAPSTTMEFTDAVKGEVLEAKDAVLEKAKASVQSAVSSFIEDVKGRAAANPAATLAIGAGIAWQLIRHPPITTALVGAGLLSLYRTRPAPVNGRNPEDYVSHAKRRLVEQASDAADMAKAEARELSKAVSEKVSSRVEELKSGVQDLTAQAASKTRQVAEEASRRANNLLNSGAEEVLEAPHFRFINKDRLSSSWQDPAVRDNLLLGASGIAILTALALALDRRLKTPERARH
jgi:uncharacterized phage infection (PIP) family protein YhgE